MFAVPTSPIELMGFPAHGTLKSSRSWGTSDLPTLSEAPFWKSWATKRISTGCPVLKESPPPFFRGIELNPAGMFIRKPFFSSMYLLPLESPEVVSTAWAALTPTRRDVARIAERYPRAFRVECDCKLLHSLWPLIDSLGMAEERKGEWDAVVSSWQCSFVEGLAFLLIHWRLGVKLIVWWRRRHHSTIRGWYMLVVVALIEIFCNFAPIVRLTSCSKL